MINPLFLWIFSMISPFGTWESPISSEVIVQDAIRFADMQAGPDTLYWLELHPKEKGRYALIRYDGTETPLATDVSVRTRVHEYGGGAFHVSKKGVVISNDEDRQLYLLKEDGSKEQLTNDPTMRFADGSEDIWVAEKHGDQVENFLVRVKDGACEIIASGHDFYTCPRISPDGKKLAFITWDFPYMQWDSSYLWLAEIDERGKLSEPKLVSGGQNESVTAAQWSPEGVLHFVSDKTGFWNIYSYKNGETQNLCEMEAEFAPPPWVFGKPSYCFLKDGRIACCYTIHAVDHLGIIDPKTKRLEDLKLPFTAISSVVSIEDKVYFLGATPLDSNAIISYDLSSRSYGVIKKSLKFALSDEWVSKGELIEYPAQEGGVGYAFYYPPTNPNFSAPEGEKPPLIVKCHGGPTGHSATYFMLDVQFWTSRGFAFVDVNYGGSTGHGRDYFKRLEKNWGIVDVEDCVSVCKVLVEKGLVDEKRLLIRGGSAGGYTTLAALAFTDIFAGGTSYYGVSDLELLYEDTHKFESQYTDILIGPYPEALELIRERSPINHMDKITKPVLLLQGDEDKIVLPNQSFTIFEALKKKGIPTGMILFEGEGHGFRLAPNIKKAFEAELYFYGKILHLALPEKWEEPPVEVYEP